MFRRLLQTMLALAAPDAAQAEWSTATSRHFVVYTETGPASAKETAEKLEKYFFVLKTMSGLKQDDASVRIKLYMVADSNAVRSTVPSGGTPGMVGYTNTTIRGPYAVMPRTLVADGLGMSAQHVLFHELAHVFMRQYFPAAYPTWYSEGFADFYGSTVIKPRDVVEIGAPVENRYISFSQNNWLPLRRVLTAHRYGDVGLELHTLYAEGWLLVHYLSTTNKRPGQLASYLQAINAGQSFEQAADTAFGDIEKLNSELQTYGHREKLQLMVLPFKAIDVGPIEARTLSSAQSDMVPFEIALSAGVAPQNVTGFADRAVAVAARYPNDVTVLADLVDIQRLARRTTDAQATAARWLTLAPNDGMAIAASAMVRADALTAAQSKDPVAWTAVRRSLADANRKAPDQPRILRAYYDSYGAQGIGAPESAQPVLYQAFDLLRANPGLRRQVAADFEARGMIDDAITIIKPLAYDIGDSASSRTHDDDTKAKIPGAAANDDHDEANAYEMLKRLEAKKAKAKS